MTDILFVDTESNPQTKQPECISLLFNDQKFIVEDFNDNNFKKISEVWGKARSIVMFNATYDLGALSIFFKQNSYKWIVKNINNEKSASWQIKLFDNNYEVRKLSFFRNFIKSSNIDKSHKKSSNIDKSHKKGTKSTPVVDILKLWSILISEENISLKALIKNELHVEAIQYSEENARTEAYRFQDVEKLKELTELFFKKIEKIEETKNFSWEDWSYIKTPATFTKILYEKQYPELKKWKKENDEVVKNTGLEKALEGAFHGGITLAMHRGDIGKCFWVDIKGAYSKAIEVLNTDRFLKFNIEKCNVDQLNFVEPFICFIQSNFIIKSVNKSLKLFYVKEKQNSWIWNFDIVACDNLISDFSYNILEVYKPIPQVETKNSLTVSWNSKKDSEKKQNGKTTLYQFFKFLSNTSYGIKAQRKPFQTNHTNMIIAGMITSKVHEILSKIIRTVEKNGYKNKYNDTDSVCAQITDTEFDISIINKINSAIAPFEIEFEGTYDNTRILSLKRYVSIQMQKIYDESGFSKNDKVKLHGKSRYKISYADISEYAMKQTHNAKNKYLEISQMAANTEISMKQILNIYPFLEEFKHPFMFVKNVSCDRTLEDFLQSWYYHVDTKTTFKQKEPFEREFHVFDNIREAEEFFKNCVSSDEANDMSDSFRAWDNEIKEDFTVWTDVR